VEGDPEAEVVRVEAEHLLDLGDVRLDEVERTGRRLRGEQREIVLAQDFAREHAEQHAELQAHHALVDARGDHSADGLGVGVLPIDLFDELEEFGEVEDIRFEPLFAVDDQDALHRLGQVDAEIARDQRLGAADHPGIFCLRLGPPLNRSLVRLGSSHRHAPDEIPVDQARLAGTLRPPAAGDIARAQSGYGPGNQDCTEPADIIVLPSWHV
jgi:hypothetical protein